MKRSALRGRRGVLSTNPHNCLFAIKGIIHSLFSFHARLLSSILLPPHPTSSHPHDPFYPPIFPTEYGCRYQKCNFPNGLHILYTYRLKWENGKEKRRSNLLTFPLQSVLSASISNFYFSTWHVFSEAHCVLEQHLNKRDRPFFSFCIGSTGTSGSRRHGVPAEQTRPLRRC